VRRQYPQQGSGHLAKAVGTRHHLVVAAAFSVVVQHTHFEGYLINKVSIS
jgi:hypothetical protein